MHTCIIATLYLTNALVKSKTCLVIKLSPCLMTWPNAIKGTINYAPNSWVRKDFGLFRAMSASQYACARQRCSVKSAKWTNTRTIAVFDVVWSGVWWIANFTKHNQTASNRVAKRQNVCSTSSLIVFGHQTFHVWPELFGQQTSLIVFGHQTFHVWPELFGQQTSLIVFGHQTFHVWPELFGQQTSLIVFGHQTFHVWPELKKLRVKNLRWAKSKLR